MTSESGRITGREAICVALVLVAAALLRVGLPGLTEFKADEARLLSLALNMVRGEYASRGISSSVGLPNFPMSVWLYALPLAVWQHPYAATIFTGLLSTLAVAGGYWLGRRYWGVTAALAATVMFALSPWAIVFSRKIWAQNLLPVFVVGWAICAAVAFVDGRRPIVALHVLFLAVAIQIHPAAVGLAPATLLLLLVFRRRVSWRWVLVGGVLSFLTMLPFLWYLGTRWRADGGLSLAASQASGEISADSLRLALTLALGQGVEALAGEALTRQALNIPLLTLAYALWVLLMGLGAIWMLVQVARNRALPSAQVGFTWLVWFLAPIFVFLWHRTPVYIHYFIAVLPAPYLLAGVLFQRIVTDVRPALRAATWAALLAAGLVLLHAWGTMMILVARQPESTAFGVPLATKLLAADAARAMRDETAASEILVAGAGARPAQDDFAAEFDALLWDTPRRFVDINREAVFPAGASVVVLDGVANDEPSSTRELYASAAARTSRIGRVRDGEAYTIMALAPASAPPAEVEVSPSVLLSNWVRFTGYNTSSGTDADLLWDVHWQPGDSQDPADYHFFNHLLDETGMRVAQSDAAAFSGLQWRPGDRVISRFWLPIESNVATPLSMRVGMYRYPSLEAVPVLDEAANPVADAVDWPLSD